MFQYRLNQKIQISFRIFFSELLLKQITRGDSEGGSESEGGKRNGESERKRERT